jgi:CubicO group peptidase (beta-lactamase class C family)
VRLGFDGIALVPCLSPAPFVPSEVEAHVPAGSLAARRSTSLGKNGWRVAVQAAAAVLLLAGPAPAQQAASTPLPVRDAAAALLPTTAALFDRYVADGKVPGIVGAFGVGDFPTVFLSAGRIATDADAPAAGPDSLWRIYSMTKPVTAMAAMLLVEDGRLALDDPVAKYIPAFARMRVLTAPDASLASVPAQRPITIRMLLTHTSGLGYHIEARGPLLKEYERLGLLPYTLNAATEAKARAVRPSSLAAFADRAAQAPLVAQPGTAWHYSMGLDVLAAVVEKASGQPFARFVQARLLDPLTMRDTGWQVPAAAAGRFATHYAVVLGRLAPLDPARTSPFLQPPGFPYGGAGLVSSARDYDRFLHMLQENGTLDGVRVMKPETVALALSDLLPAGVAFTPASRSMTGARGRLGFGAGGFVTLADVPGGPAKGTYGWDGAANTLAFVDRARHARGTVMVNISPFDVYPLRGDVTTALAQDVARLRGGK